jgi:hypothetical protein
MIDPDLRPLPSVDDILDFVRKEAEAVVLQVLDNFDTSA